MLDSLTNLVLNSDWVAFPIVGAILLLVTEFGFRIGRSHTPERRQAHQGQSGALQGALLGLLGLLLGFTFAMAVGRYEARKQLVLDEANGVGTVWLRAGYLSEPARDLIRSTLADYVDARLKGAAAPAGSEAFQEQAARSERDQAAMWKATVAEIKTSNTPSTALFTSSLNDLIDLDGKRQAASRNHVPSTVWLLLMLVAITVCWTSGYTTSLGESGRHALSMVILPLLLTVVITIIADLDHPQRGLIKVSQQSMVDVQNTLKKYQ